MKTIRLREGKERSLLRRHPWIFQGSLAKGGGDAGETVRVESHDGRFLAWAAFSPRRRPCSVMTRSVAPSPRSQPARGSRPSSARTLTSERSYIRARPVMAHSRSAITARQRSVPVDRNCVLSTSP